MNLEFSLLENVEIGQLAYSNGFENEPIQEAGSLVLSSSRYPVKLLIAKNLGDFSIESTSPAVNAELMRHFDASLMPIRTSRLEDLAEVINKAAAFAFALPNNALEAYQAELNKIIIETPTQTETLAMVKRRIGQQKYREAMMTYWGGRCAVTGVAIPEVLRASHAKPWAECETDAERLDVYNGFLLAAHLDALFDQFLISFDESGLIVISDQISADDCTKLGIQSDLKLRWITEQHKRYLVYHVNQLKQLLMFGNF
ncbi:HNH endonuclease [Thiomicrospira microaerophila]|uniref:HNH endonuclease n=1 Tax=Thiomicrospira microaerophila TaxID=406020 RepID=UPI0005CB6ECF|nr:HNH endonuclease [Thiomicrospira microaerophila]